MQLEAASAADAAEAGPSGSDVPALLAGSWKLLYTANSELMPLLALGRLPLVEVGDVTQVIDGPRMTVTNAVQLRSPLAEGGLAATAAFEVGDPPLRAEAVQLIFIPFSTSHLAAGRLRHPERSPFPFFRTDP